MTSVAAGFVQRFGIGSVISFVVGVATSLVAIPAVREFVNNLT